MSVQCIRTSDVNDIPSDPKRNASMGALLAAEALLSEILNQALVAQGESSKASGSVRDQINKALKKNIDALAKKENSLATLQKWEKRVGYITTACLLVAAVATGGGMLLGAGLFASGLAVLGAAGMIAGGLAGMSSGGLQVTSAVFMGENADLQGKIGSENASTQYQSDQNRIMGYKMSETLGSRASIQGELSSLLSELGRAMQIR